MARARTSFVCEDCGAVQSQWAGRCPECDAWDTLSAFTEQPDEPSGAGDSGADSTLAGQRPREMAPALPLAEIGMCDVPRIPTGIEEIDRVLGGGFVPGAAMLLGGDPGIGKSTLLMQVAGALATPEQRVLYASSEESASQVRLRAERLGIAASPREPSLFVLAETDLGRIIQEARRLEPSFLLLDSIQMTWLGSGGSPGSDSGRAQGGVATQLRRCATELSLLAKRTGMTVILVGHVTKDGQLAGPKLLEHLVDVVLAFEGDRHHRHRILRGVKNRFGSTQEIGLFEMTGDGLEPVCEHSVRLDGGDPPAPGAVIVPTMAGSRCLLAEIQALTATGFLGSAKRRASGLDAARLAMLIAVLEKHGGLRLADQDIFVSVAGGLRIHEPGADLATALAIAGAHARRCLPAGTAVFGELTLSGALRAAPGAEQRVSEAIRRGAHTVLVPRQQVEDLAASAGGAQVIGIARLVEALEFLVPADPAQPRPSSDPDALQTVQG